jgi:plasmid stabilization system protein ParE
MSLAVFWSDEANETFDSIVLFIENKWSERQAETFVKHTQKILSLIAEQPYMYKRLLTILLDRLLFLLKLPCITKSIMDT